MNSHKSKQNFIIGDSGKSHNLNHIYTPNYLRSKDFIQSKWKFQAITKWWMWKKLFVEFQTWKFLHIVELSDGRKLQYDPLYLKGGAQAWWQSENTCNLEVELDLQYILKMRHRCLSRSFHIFVSHILLCCWKYLSYWVKQYQNEA